MRYLTPAILLLLAGCGGANDEREGTGDDQASHAVAAGFRPGGPAPMATVAVDPVPAAKPGTILPPATMQYRFIGRWAANPALCETGAWQFETRKLTTAGETSCTFETVAAVLNGYRLEGTCSAEGREDEQVLEIDFDEAKRRMHLDGETLGPVDLIYCGA